MPASFNRVFILGNLTRDPELRYIPSGQAVTTFTVAVNRSYVAASGEKKEEVSFIRVVVWGRHAEICNEYLRKGSSVFVEGRLQSRSWDAPDGTKRSTIEVVSQSVQFVGRPVKQSGPEGERAPASVDDAIIDDSFGAGASSDKSEQGPAAGGDEVPF